MAGDMLRRRASCAGTVEDVLNQLPDNLCLKNTFIDEESKPVLRRHNSEPIIKTLEVSFEPTLVTDSLNAALVSPESTVGNQGLKDRVSDVFFDGREFGSFRNVPDIIDTPRSFKSQLVGSGGQDWGDPGKQSTDGTVSPTSDMYHPLPEETLVMCGEDQRGFACIDPWAVQWQPWPISRPLRPLMSIEMGNFVEAISCMANSLAQQLKSCMNIPVAVKIIFQDDREWSIFCRVHEEHIETYQHTICSLAKELIWYAAAASTVFLLLGCHSEPFKQKYHGFKAIVAPVMRNPNVACMDLYTKGTCRWEKRCQWEHPHPLFRHRLIFVVKALTEMAPIILATAGSCSSEWYPSR